MFTTIAFRDNETLLTFNSILYGVIIPIQCVSNTFFHRCMNPMIPNYIWTFGFVHYS